MSAQRVTLSLVASHSPHHRACERRKEEKERERRATNGLGSVTSTSSRGSLVADNKMHDLPFRLLERVAKRAYGARKRSYGSNSGTPSKRNTQHAFMLEREKRRRKERGEYNPLYSTARHVTKGDPHYIRATGRRHEL